MSTHTLATPNFPEIMYFKIPFGIFYHAICMKGMNY